MSTSQPVTIFEGPDGSGKTTAAQAFALATGARYVHLGPFRRVTTGLGRLYAEAMLPAVLGYQPVVLDRCWLSEHPYGVAFRAGAMRLALADQRMLERLALRCGAVVVRCQPPWEVVRRNYAKRQADEMLENEAQLKTVYDLYRLADWTALPVLDYDYTQEHTPKVFHAHVEDRRPPCHSLFLASAGHWDATSVLVGESFGAVKNLDPLYQWPFASFGATGCSRWLTNNLINLAKPENELLWVNADQPLERLVTPARRFYALGEVAFEQLSQTKAKHIVKLPHPQSHKRFRSSEPYPLRFT